MDDVFDFGGEVEVGEGGDDAGERVGVCSCHVDGGAGVGAIGEGPGAGEEL